MSGVSIVIVAAGRGSRMGQGDKLFMEVAGLPLVGYTWRFDRFGDSRDRHRHPRGIPFTL